MSKHAVIPDTQVRPGINLDHFTWLSNYLAEKRPDVIVHLGDHYDMPSLCVYDEDMNAVMSRRLRRDVLAGDTAFRLLTENLRHNTTYKPRLVYLLGNHEDRFNRLLAKQPNLRGAIIPPWAYPQALGWRVIPYLQPITIDGITYCHQFCKSSNGRVTSSKWGAPNARAQCLRELRSCTAGHKPGLDYHMQPAGARSLHSLIVGSCYRHAEDWMTPQGNRYWRGIIVKHEVHDGEYDIMCVSLSYLKRRYS